MDKRTSLNNLALAFKAVLVLVFASVFLSLLKGFSFGGFCSLLSSAYCRSLVFKSFYIAFLSAFFSLVIGFSVAVKLARRSFRLREALLAVSRLPYILPPITIILCASSLFSGPLYRFIGFLYSLKGIVFVHVFYNWSLVFNILSSSCMNLDMQGYESAMISGAGRTLSFCVCLLPRLRRSIVSAFCLVFLYSFTSFSIVMTFGGIRNSNLQTEIYRKFIMGGDPSLAMLCMCISAIFVLLFLLANRKDNVVKNSSEVKLSKGNLADEIIAAISVLIIVVPLISVFFRIAGNGLSELNALSSFLPEIIKSAAMSVLVSVSTTFMAFVISSSSRRTGSRDLVVIIPQMFSSVMMAAGLRAVPWLSLYAAHILISLPVVYFVLRSEYAKYPQSLIDESGLLGSSDICSAFVVEIRSMKQAVTGSLFISFAYSLGDVNTTLVISYGKFKTLSTLIYSAISHYRFATAAMLNFVFALLAIGYYAICRVIVRHVWK